MRRWNHQLSRTRSVPKEDPRFHEKEARMKPASAVAWLVLAVPGAALAVASHSEVTIAREAPIIQDSLRTCMARGDALGDRKAFLDDEKRLLDREGEAIARDGAALADELRRLQPTDTAAVGAYNVRSAEHNLHVAAHNRRVMDMNTAAASLNDASADMMAYCQVWAVRQGSTLR
jgi:hypothetical protein